MKTKYEDFEVLIPNAEGTAVAERVKVKIPLRWDSGVEEWVLTPEAHELIDNTKARHMGLLLPEEFKALRKRLGYSQKEMGELFQAGDKSWTRWESGQHRPSRSLSLLIRAVYEGELSVDYLLERLGKTALGPIKPIKAIKTWFERLKADPDPAPLAGYYWAPIEIKHSVAAMPAKAGGAVTPIKAGRGAGLAWESTDAEELHDFYVDCAGSSRSPMHFHSIP